MRGDLFSYTFGQDGSQLPFNLCENRLPIVPLRLSEQTHGWIPRTVFAVEKPAPIRDVLQKLSTLVDQRRPPNGGSKYRT